MKKILFVCTGNTCRSPMAAAILNNMNIDGIEVESAGIYAIPGCDASEYVKELLKENQIDYNHVSKPLNDQLVKWADLILVMTTAHKNNVLAMFTDAKDKVYTLREYATGEEGDVEDPFGGSLDIYRKTFQELQELIQKAVKKMSAKDDE